jgi:hypothetical protein
MDRFAREASVSAQQPLTHLFTWPMGMMLRSQSNLVSAMQDAFVAFSRLMHCRNAGEAFAIQQQWFSSNLRRFGGAFAAYAEETTAASDDAAKAARDRAKPSLEAARAETSRRAAHRIHHTSRRAKRRDASTSARNKSPRKPRKSRKRRAA